MHRLLDRSCRLLWVCGAYAGVKGQEPGGTGPDAYPRSRSVFDPRQVFQRSIGQPGNRYGDIGKPRHVAVGSDGVLFVANSEFAHIHLFKEQGQLLMLLGGTDGGLGGSVLPVGVAVARSLPVYRTRLRSKRS